MDVHQNCPKCGAEMDERPLTMADGTPLGFSDEDSTGALNSLVCPSCGYAELRAASGTDVMAGQPAASAAGADVGPRASDQAVGGGDSGLRSLDDVLGEAFPVAEPRDPGVGALVALVVSAALAVAGIVWINMASGPVMMAGGFVAAGGPYVIAHPAEDWIWLPTVGATVMTFALLANYFISAQLKRPATTTILVFWTALFGSCSYEFFKYGFHGPDGGRVWTWIVLGIVFALMALPAVFLLFLPDSWRGFKGAYAWAQGIGVVGGILGGLWIWRVVAG